VEKLSSDLQCSM